MKSKRSGRVASSRSKKAAADIARNGQIGIDSIETGMQLLLAFVKLGGRTHQLKVLAQAAAMPPSKAHRYLVSLIRMGFVDRDAVTGYYRLGPKSIELGASAVHAMDAISLATELLVELRDELNLSIVLSVWGSQAPVILRVEEAENLITVSYRVGKSLPLLASAAGLLYSALLPRHVIEPLLQAELLLGSKRRHRNGHLIRSMSDADKLLTDVRARGIARIAGDITPGINAVAAPIFDNRGYPAAVITAVGPAGSFDYGWSETVATTLHKRTGELSRKLGFTSPATGRLISSKSRKGRK
jgi:DNA-binding IclR family transcriptional regulator